MHNTSLYTPTIFPGKAWTKSDENRLKIQRHSTAYIKSRVGKLRHSKTITKLN